MRLVFFLLWSPIKRPSPSVWVMSSIEIEKWDAIFDRAIVVASKTAQTKDIVVSHFLKLLGEAKLVSWVIYSLLASRSILSSTFRLKQTPALLKTLLRASSTGDSTLNIDLLTSVDAVLVSSYCHSDEHVELGLDLLHFLGGLIPMVADSEFVQFLSSLQAGMTMWIIDEDTLLSDDQHKNLVSLSLVNFWQSMNPYLFLDYWYLLCISGQTGTPGTFHNYPQCHCAVYPISFCPSSRTWTSSFPNVLASDLSYTARYS